MLQVGQKGRTGSLALYFCTLRTLPGTTRYCYEYTTVVAARLQQCTASSTCICPVVKPATVTLRTNTTVSSWQLHSAFRTYPCASHILY